MGSETSTFVLPLNELPDEMIIEIVSQLAPHKQVSVAACCQVNRKWYKLLHGPVLYRKVLLHGIRLEIGLALRYRGLQSNGSMDWRYPHGWRKFTREQAFRVNFEKGRLEDDYYDSPCYSDLRLITTFTAGRLTDKRYKKLNSYYFHANIRGQVYPATSRALSNFCQTTELTMGKQYPNEHNFLRRLSHTSDTTVHLYSFHFPICNTAVPEPITIIYNGPGYAEETFRLYLLHQHFRAWLPAFFATYFTIHHWWTWKLCFLIKFKKT
jgi:hypothetical protein